LQIISLKDKILFKKGVTVRRVFFVFLLVSITFLSANETNGEGVYEFAQKYENENKTTEAFLWHKKAAQNPKKTDDSNLKLENSLKKESLHREKNGTALDEKDYLKDLTSEYEDNDTKNTVIQMVDSLFGVTTYNSNYLLPLKYDFKSHGDNRKHTETLFQLSFKKDLIKNLFGFNEVFGVAYTQRSWWQTLKKSSPFRETNYLPEIYLSLPHISKKTFFKAYKIGFLHESNGQGEKNSRSWNRLYAEIILQYKGVFITPRVWYRLKESEKYDDNKDILEYMGYGDLILSYPYKNQLFTLLLRNNFDFDNNKGAVQFDWTFPIAKSGVFGYIRYFDGYGESLIDYNKKIRHIGIGLAFSR
jgi:phospholipase A1